MLVKKRKRQKDSCSEDEGPAKKKTQLFTGISFRKALKGDNAVAAIKEFLSLCKSEDAHTVALQYLEAGGGALELLGLLQSEQKKSISMILPVFSALQYIIMSTVTDAQKYRASTEEACKHLLSHHLLTIHDMLSMKKGTSKHRRVALKLLAAMVTLSPRLAQMVLTHVKIGPYLWSSLVKHTKPVEKSIRTSFIHFLMAFLFDGNLSVIRPLLEMKGFLASIIPGLVYDSAETVHLVLTTLQNKILMNMAISKTNKLHIFNTPILRSLVALYEWKGPLKWKPTFKERAEDSKILQEEETEERKEDKQIVTDAVHSFLQILCTSHKYGVIFHDRSVGTSGKKHNELLQTVLDNLEKPWEHNEMAELVHGIVIACPDLMKCVLLNIEPFLEPRVSVLWVKTINFVKQLVQSMNPEQCLKPYMDGLSTHQITNVVQNLCTPPILLRALSTGLLEHKHIVIRNEALGLLVVMLQSFNNFMTSIEQWHPLDSVSEHAFKQNIIKQLPTSEIMLSLWKTMLSHSDESENEDDFQPSPLVQEPSLSSHLVAIIDLFLIYNNCFPHAFDIPSSTNFLADIEQIMKHEDDIDGIATVQERILKLLISMDMFAFTPDKELFGDAISRLSHLVNYPSSVIPLQARNLLCTLLINTGLFEGTLSEVFVWLHCYLAVSAEQRKSVVKLLVDSIVRVSENTATYIDYILQAEEAALEENKDAFDSSQFEDIFDELLEDSDGEYNEEEKKKEQESVLAKATVALSPLFPGVLETAAADKEQLEDVKHFLSYVAVHLLHCQPSNNIISHLVHQWPGLIPSSITSYINCWSSDQSPQPLKKPFGSHSLENKISKILLQSVDIGSKHRVDSNKLSDSTQESSEVINFESLKTKDPVQILLLYKMSTFHMVQMASQGEFTEKLRDKCKDILLSLLQIFSEIDKKEDDETNVALFRELLNLIGEEKLSIHCLKHTFTHPFLLQKFTPVCRKKYVIEKLITELILDLVKLSSASKKDFEVLHEYLKPFKYKLISQILCRLKKSQKNKTSWLNVEGIVSMIELFELDFSDIMKLFERLVLVPSEALICTNDDSSSMSVWSSLLVHLLDRCVSIHRSVKQKVIASLVNQLSQLTREKNIDISPLEDSFLKYLEQFPHHIDHISTKLVYSLLYQEVNSAACTRLLVLLLSRKPVFIHDFISQVRKTKNLRQNASLVFPLLAVALKMNVPIEHVILSKIYSEHELQIEKAFLKPHKIQECYKDNISTVAHLVNKCMGVETCLRLCQDMKKQAVTIIQYETFYVELIKCIFFKVSENEDDGKHFTELLLLYFEMMVNLLKQETLNQTLIGYLCHMLQTIISDNAISINHSKLITDMSWKSFIKMCLKFGLQSSENIDENLLDTLSKLFAAFFDNDTDDDQLSTIFHLTLSHSEFLNIMLGSAKKKEKLVEWLVILAKKNPSVMSSKHIPVYLSAYNATLSTTDKLILKLLKLYEANGISLYEYRPYLWGEAAVSHYSVRSNVAMSLWRQPSANHVMGLLNKESVLETIRNFPLTRGLHDSETSVFCDEAVYDPAFYLPLFSHLLAPEAVVQVYKFITSGGFALTLAALASNCEDTRAAAYLVIARMYFHSEVIRNVKGRMLGLQFLDAIRNGVMTMRNKLENPQVSSIVAIFLARTSLILPETHHTMYIPLQSFIIAKASLDMNTVPEFFTFMHSPDVEHKVYRYWILQVIRDGLRSNLDFQLSERCVVFKLLLGFYPSTLCDENTKNLILRVLESAVKIQTPAEILVSKNGLISWLHRTIQELPKDNTNLKSSAISIVYSLWTTLSASKDPKDISILKKKLTSVHLPQQVLLLTLELLQKNIKLSIPDLKMFLQTISGVVLFENTKAVCSILSVQIMNKILSMSKEVLGSVSDCEDLLSYGCKFASRTLECETGTDSEQATFHLRSLVVTWLQKMYNGNAPR